MAATNNSNFKRIGRAATCAGLALLIAAQPALAATATASGVTATAISSSSDSRLTCDEYTRTVWSTSDGQEFSTEGEAKAHARTTVPAVTEDTKQQNIWLTSDGNEFASQAAADAHADGVAPTVQKKTETIHHEAVTETRYKTMWSSCAGSPYYKDGFATAEEAELWWEQAGRQAEEDGYTGTLKGAIPYSVPYTVTVTPAHDEEVTTWLTSDGDAFDTEAEAKSHRDALRPTVSPSTKTVPVWNTSDGKSFDAEQDARAYAEAQALTVAAKTRTVHHDAVTHREEIITWSSCAGSPYYKDGFATAEEAELWWEQAGRQAEEDGYTGTLMGTIPIINYKTVVDVPAYDEQIPYWQTSDGATFDYEADAVAHSRSTVPTVSEDVAHVWRTSDGKEFDAEDEATSYAESCALKVTSREETYTVWVAPYDQKFDSREEAEAYLADLDALEAAGLAPFSDVSSSDWSFRWTVRAAARGLMSGYSGTTLFGPNDLLTRCQVATVLWRAAGSPEPASAKSYPDVEDGWYYEKAVAWCAEQGIVTGYTGGPNAGKFCPWSNVTREELATMAARWAKSRGHELAIDQDAVNGLRIDDWSYVSGWAQDSITRTASAGILGGVDNGNGTHSLQPQGCATRAQAAKVFVVLQDAAN